MNFYNDKYTLYLCQLLSVNSLIQNLLNKIQSVESFKPREERMRKKYLFPHCCLQAHFCYKPF
jgi:hypothetical protein